MGLDVNRQVAVYHRWASLDDGSVDNVVVVPNFSPEHGEINPPVPFDGLWVVAHGLHSLRAPASVLTRGEWGSRVGVESSRVVCGRPGDGRGVDG